MPSQYPPPHIISPHPDHHHTHTIILLHGTSGNGLEFSTSFLSSTFPDPFPPPPSSSLATSNSNTLPPPTSQDFSSPAPTRKTTLPEIFPSIRWVFPTGRPRNVTALNGRLTNAWFDVHAFSDRTIGERDSISGLRESAVYLTSLVQEEVKILDEISYQEENVGTSEHEDGKGGARIFIGGFSQGAAMSATLLLSGELALRGVDVAGWFCMSGWLPFRAQVEMAMNASGITDKLSERVFAARSYVRHLLDLKEKSNLPNDGFDTILYVQHGKGDQKMLLEWGKQMFDCFEKLGCNCGMEVFEMGHWWSEESLAGFARWFAKCLEFRAVQGIENESI